MPIHHQFRHVANDVQPYPARTGSTMAVDNRHLLHQIIGVSNRVNLRTLEARTGQAFIEPLHALMEQLDRQVLKRGIGDSSGARLKQEILKLFAEPARLADPYEIGAALSGFAGGRPMEDAHRAVLNDVFDGNTGLPASVSPRQAVAVGADHAGRSLRDAIIALAERVGTAGQNAHDRGLVHLPPPTGPRP